MQTPTIKWDDYGRRVTKTPSINRHTFKFDTYLQDFDPNKPPVINAPLPNPNDKSYKAKIKEMKRMTIGLFSLGVILPFIFVKYPDLHAKCRILKSYLKLIGENSIPIVDDRWDRSMVEWIEILSYAKEYGYNAASRKFFALKNEERIYLSPNYIKQKAKAFDRAYAHLCNRERVNKYEECLLKIQKVLKNDRQLQNLLKKMRKQYLNKTLNKIVDHKMIYSYSYYYIRHYDPKLYKKQKSKFEKGEIKKAQVNGKIECGPFKVRSIKDTPHQLTFDIMIDLIKFMRKRGDL
jgi:hypothetical protein